MYDPPPNPTGDPADPTTGPGHSIWSLVLLIAMGAVLGTLALGLVFWIVGLAFHLFGMIVRVAILAAVAAFVWKRVMRGRCRIRS